jgi:hypothetical protein
VGGGVTGDDRGAHTGRWADLRSAVEKAGDRRSLRRGRGERCGPRRVALDETPRPSPPNPRGSHTNPKRQRGIPQVTCGATPVPSLTLRASMRNGRGAQLDQCLPTFLVVFSVERLIVAEQPAFLERTGHRRSVLFCFMGNTSRPESACAARGGKSVISAPGAGRRSRRSTGTITGHPYSPQIPHARPIHPFRYHRRSPTHHHRHGRGSGYSCATRYRKS